MADDPLMQGNASFFFFLTIECFVPYSLLNTLWVLHLANCFSYKAYLS